MAVGTATATVPRARVTARPSRLGRWLRRILAVVLTLVVLAVAAVGVGWLLTPSVDDGMQVPPRAWWTPRPRVR